MSVTILLIRHASHGLLGHVLCGRMAGVALDEAGRAQAAGLAEGLSGAGIVAVYASPLERAVETAAPVAARCGLSVKFEAGPQEIDFGVWTGCRFEALEGDAAWQRWNRCRQLARAPEGEAALEAQCRMVAFLHVVAERHREGVVAIFSHADVIKSAMAWALGASLDLHDRFDIEPASVSRLQMGDQGVRVTALNGQVSA